MGNQLSAKNIKEKVNIFKAASGHINTKDHWIPPECSSECTLILHFCVLLEGCPFVKRLLVKVSKDSSWSVLHNK